MRLLLTLVLILSGLNAAKILSYNVYDRTDRVDIMFTFDTPYDGTLRQSRQQDKVIIKLPDATIESPKVKNITSPFVSKLAITPIDGETQIIATVASSTIQMQASKTSDAFGLRLRFFKSSPATAATPTATSNNPVAALPTKPEDAYNASYAIVIAILILGIVILLWLKSRIGTGTTPAAPGSRSKNWLFKSTNSDQGVKVRFQKALDQKNRVVMLDHGEESYLVIIGTSNILLDKFHGNRPVDQNAFEKMLHEKHDQLDSFLQLDPSEHAQQEPLQSYKQKASGGIAYDRNDESF